MMGLECAYTRVKEIIGPERAECLDVVKQVERLRSTWRPERVRVVLLAESHVWTSYEEAQSRVTQPNDMQPNGVEPGFARFVYCLGYGEQKLVPTIKKNRGTPQYWGLFWNTVRDPQLKVVGERDWEQRVKNKRALLMKMQRAGIWLIDASVTALYRQGRKKLVTGADYRAVLEACWECYIGQVLCECTPSAVLIVGRGVGSVIERAVRQELGSKVEVQTIYQPNARMPRGKRERDMDVCFELCSSV